MKKGSSKDFFSYEVPRYIKIILSDNSEEIAEVQSWTEIVRLRRDMTLEEQQKFDKDYQAWSQEGKINRNYVFSEQDIRLIKYCLKTYLSDFQFRHIIEEYKSGELDKIVNDPQVIEFVNSFLNKKQFQFVLLLSLVKRLLNKQQYIQSIHLADIIESKNITLQPIVKNQVNGSILNIFLRFSNLDKFRLAQLKLLNQKIQFEQMHLTEKIIEVFSSIFNQAYNKEIQQNQQLEGSQLQLQAAISISDSPYISQQSDMTEIKSENESQKLNMEVEISNNSNINNENCMPELENETQNFDSGRLSSQTFENEMCSEQEEQISSKKPNENFDKIKEAFKIMQILKRENINFFITFKRQKLNSVKTFDLLDNVLPSLISCQEDAKKQQNILKEKGIMMQGINNFLAYQKKRHQSKLQDILK